MGFLTINIFHSFRQQGRPMPSGPVPQANQTRPANYKYTANMRNPPAHNVPMVPQAPPVQAVHVKGSYLIL